MNEQTPTVNGITFFTFCTHLRGYSVLNKKGKEIPKFLLYHSKISIDDVFNKYKIIARL